jgi:hypothetical protein
MTSSGSGRAEVTKCTRFSAGIPVAIGAEYALGPPKFPLADTLRTRKTEDLRRKCGAGWEAMPLRGHPVSDPLARYRARRWLRLYPPKSPN